jgi:hypothetical protein
VIIGALNWGLAGAFNLDLVAALFGVRFGETSGITTVVYSLVWPGGPQSSPDLASDPTPLAGDDPRSRLIATSHFQHSRRSKYVATPAHPRASLIGDDFAAQTQ